VVSKPRSPSYIPLIYQSAGFCCEPCVPACPELVEGREKAFIAFIATVLSQGSRFSPAVRPENGRAEYPAVENIAFNSNRLFPSLPVPSMTSVSLWSKNVAFYSSRLFPCLPVPSASEACHARGVTSSALKQCRLLLGCHWIPGHRLRSARNDLIFGFGFGLGFGLNPHTPALPYSLTFLTKAPHPSHHPRAPAGWLQTPQKGHKP
jgi:hypothetical protein